MFEKEIQEKDFDSEKVDFVSFPMLLFVQLSHISRKSHIKNRTSELRSQTARVVYLKSCGPANDWLCTFGMDTCQVSGGIAHSHNRT